MDNRFLVFGNIFLLSLKLENFKVFKEFLKPLTIKQWFLIVSVVNFFDKPSISEVANFLGSSQQNIKVICKKLEQKNFIELVTDSNDRRVTRIVLLEPCLTYLQTKDSYATVKVNELFTDFTEEELKNFVSYINKLMTSIESMEE